MSRFLNPIFFPNLINCSNLLDLRNLQEQVKKAFCFKNCTDLSLLEKIVLVISKICKFSTCSFKFRKIMSKTRTNFFTIDHINNGNKIPFLTSALFTLQSFKQNLRCHFIILIFHISWKLCKKESFP